MSAFFNNLAGNTNLLNPQALEANRRGEITETQKQRLNASHGWEQVLGAVIAIFMLGSSVCFLSVLFISGSITSVLIPLLVTGAFFLLLLLMVGRSLWKLWDSGAKFRRDQTNRAIRQGQGQLSYDEKKYVFQASGRNLALPAGSASGLVPGAIYRVYYLEESSFLLSAEEISPATPGQTRAALGEILAAANGFSFEDLAANRNGEVTAAQHRKALPNAIGGAIFCLVALALLIPSILSALSPEGETSSWPVFAIMAVIFLLIGAFMLLNALIDMLSSSAPKQVQGMGHKEKRRSGGKNRTTHYYYVVGGQSFQVKHAAYMALIDGLEYRVYYLPRTKRLISIEALDSSAGSSPF